MTQPKTYGDTPTHTAIVDWDIRSAMAWAAGFFDGEGHIGIEARSERSSHRLVLTAVQKYPEPLCALQQLFGGVVDARKAYGARSTAGYRWRISNTQAAQVLAEMRPYLIVKAAEADVALDFQSRQRRGASSTCPTCDAATKVDLEELRRLPISERKAVMSNVSV